MKPLSTPPICLFFTAILAAGQKNYITAERELQRIYGPPIDRLPAVKFGHTAYYEPEMGVDLLKGWLAFPPPFHPDELALRKRETRRIEWETGHGINPEFRRSVNIDPGYVSLFHVALATSKNFAHRFYLGEGVFAEITLLYHADGWELLPWTYPDYKIPEVMQFLSGCRAILKSHLDSCTS